MTGYKKVHLVQKQVVFLGFLIDEHGVIPDRDKVATLANSPPPTAYYGVRRFLGFVQFYASLIPRLAIRMAPIAKLLAGTKSADGRKPASSRPTHYHITSRLRLGIGATGRFRRPQKRIDHGRFDRPSDVGRIIRP